MRTAYRRDIRSPDRVNPGDGDGCRDSPRAPARLAACRSDPSRAGRRTRIACAASTGGSPRSPALLHATDPFVVDLGYGASGVTTLELAPRLAHVRPDVEVLGLEIDPARVRSARASSSRACAPGESHFAADLRVDFALGGFEVPTPDGRRPAVIRAFNVLRQYDESDVAAAWARMAVAARAGRAPRRGHVRRARARRELGRRRRLGAAHLHDQPAALGPRGTLGRRRAPAEGAHPPQRARASASTSCSPRSTARGGCTRRCRSTDRRSGGSRPSPRCGTRGGT